jgi:hypothetical protein
MTNTAKRLKSSASMSATSSFTAVVIPESQERGAALEKADLQDAIKSVLHSQQPGLFPTHIRDRLMAERKELLGKYSNKDSIKTAVNQALNIMIEKGEVVRQEATTDKGGRSHLYALLDVAQSDEQRFRQGSNDSGSSSLQNVTLTHHSNILQAGVSDLESPKLLKVESQSRADSMLRQNESSYPKAHTCAQAGDLEQTMPVTKFEKETTPQLQTLREAGVSQSASSGLCVGDDADRQGSVDDTTSHSDSPSQQSGLRKRAQGACSTRATPLLDGREPAGAEPNEGRQQREPVIEERLNGFPEGLDNTHTDISKTIMAKLGQQVLHGRKLKARRNKLIEEKATHETKRDEARSELSKSLSTVDQGMQKLEALNRENRNLRKRMFELDCELSDVKQQVDEAKQIVELKTLKVQECERFVETTEIECSSIYQELGGIVQDLDIFQVRILHKLVSG